MPNFRERARGAFELLFNTGSTKKVNGYFKMLDGYTPSFTTYDGGVYEMELTRACIHTFATHCSKLLPTVKGADLMNLQRILNTKPNAFMTSAMFLYKVATIYEAQNTCWIVPILNQFDTTIGFYPLNPMQVEIVTVEGSNEPWLRYTFLDGSKGAMELSRCGVVPKFLYKNDLVGEDNRALSPTMQLLDLQNQGIAEGIKSGASFRFMANVSNFAKADDLKRERKKFVSENLGPDSGGLALFPNTYTNVQQIKSNPQTVDAEQMRVIQTRVFDYFGSNEEILQNKCVGDAWDAYYESKIEPFAILLSQALTCMCYSREQLARGNEIVFSSNRLQYMTNKDKLTMSSQMFDRGILTFNQIMDIWNLPHIDDELGNKRFIRKEYAEISQLPEKIETQLLPENAESTEGVE